MKNNTKHAVRWAFIVVIFGWVLFGVTGLIYSIPLSFALLIILSIPIWKRTRQQTNAVLLAATFAKENGITDFGKTANNRLSPTEGS